MTEEKANYWNRTEEEYQKALRKQAEAQMRANMNLTETVEMLRQIVPEHLLEKAREHVRDTTLSNDPRLIESETQAKIDSFLVPIAKRLLEKTQKEQVTFKQNIAEEIDHRSRVKRQATYASELLSKMLPHIQKLRSADRFNLIPLRSTFNILGSLINSYNKTAENLHLFGFTTPTIPPIPTHPHELFDLFVKVQNAQILGDEWLESVRLTLSRLQAV